MEAIFLWISTYRGKRDTEIKKQILVTEAKTVLYMQTMDWQSESRQTDDSSTYLNLLL